MSRFRAINKAYSSSPAPSVPTPEAVSCTQAATAATEPTVNSTRHGQHRSVEPTLAKRPTTSKQQKKGGAHTVGVRVPMTSSMHVSSGKRVSPEHESAAIPAKRSRTSNTPATKSMAENRASLTPMFPSRHSHQRSRSRLAKVKRRQPLRDAKLYPTIESSPADQLPTPSASSNSFFSSPIARPSGHRRRYSEAVRSSRRGHEDDQDYVPSRNVTVGPSPFLAFEPRTSPSSQQIEGRSLAQTASRSRKPHSNDVEKPSHESAQIKTEPSDSKKSRFLLPRKTRSASISSESPSTKRVKQYEDEGFIEITKFEKALDDVCRKDGAASGKLRTTAQKEKRLRIRSEEHLLSEGRDIRIVKDEPNESRLADLPSSTSGEPDFKGMHPERIREIFRVSQDSVGLASNESLRPTPGNRPSGREVVSEDSNTRFAAPTKAASPVAQALPFHSTENEARNCTEGHTDHHARRPRSTDRPESHQKQGSLPHKQRSTARDSIKETLTRREVTLSSPSFVSNKGVCKCADLPEYFIRCQDRVVESISGMGPLEFEVHCEQVSRCRAHPISVINSCHRFLRKQREARKISDINRMAGHDNLRRTKSLGEYAVPLHPRANEEHRPEQSAGRAPSSIPPPKFYGLINRMGAPDGGLPDLTRSMTREKSPDVGGWQPLHIEDESTIGASLNATLTSESSLAIRVRTSEDVSPANEASKRSPVHDTTALASEAEDRRRSAPRRVRQLSLHATPTGSQASHTNPTNSRKRRAEDEGDTSDTEEAQEIGRRRAQSRKGLDRQELADIEGVFKSVLEAYDIPHRGRTAKRRLSVQDDISLQDQTVRPAQRHNSDHNAATLTRPPKRRTKSVAERVLVQPRLASDIPPQGALPESEIIRIGKLINPYERHRAAPYAFSYHGRVYKPWAYLAHKRGEDGELVWQLDVVRRVLR